jgi:hypothetical protein
MIINNPDSDFSMISVDTESDYKDDAGRTAPRGSLGYSVLLPKNKIPQLINLLAKKDINLSKVLSDIKGNIDPEANQHNPIVKDINRVRIFTSNVTDFNLHTQSANGMAKDLAQKMKVVMN